MITKDKDKLSKLNFKQLKFGALTRKSEIISKLIIIYDSKT